MKASDTPTGRRSTCWYERDSSTEAARLLTTREVCRLLRRGSGWFYKNRARLEAEGFPKPIPIVEHYDERAILKWIDHRGGQAEPLLQRDDLMERIARWGQLR